MTEELNKIDPIYFKLHLRILLFFGVDILPIKNNFLKFIYRIYSFFIVSLIGIFTVSEFLETFVNFTDINRMTFGLCYVVTHILGFVKIILLLIQRKSLWNYFQKLEKGVFVPKMERGGSEEFKLIKSAIKLCDLQGCTFLALVFLVVSNRALFAAFEHGTNIELYDETSNTTITILKRTLPYGTWFPFDTNNSPYFEMTFAFHVFSTTTYGFYIGAADAIICGFMMHFKAQFLILKKSLDTLIERAEKMAKADNKKLINLNKVKVNISKGIERVDLLSNQIQVYAEKLTRECVYHHQQIIQFCDETENEFCYLMLMQFLSSLFILCFQLFQLSLASTNKFGIYSMIFYLMLMSFQLVCYCWHGNEVQIESGNIAKYIYHINWSITNESIKKSLLLMMMRSQRPCAFSAGKFAFLSLETYMKIVRGSGSYFMVLRQMNR